MDLYSAFRSEDTEALDTMVYFVPFSEQMYIFLCRQLNYACKTALFLALL